MINRLIVTCWSSVCFGLPVIAQVTQEMQAPTLDSMEKYTIQGLLTAAIFFLYHQMNKQEQKYESTIREVKEDKDRQILQLQTRISELERRVDNIHTSRNES